MMVLLVIGFAIFGVVKCSGGEEVASAPEVVDYCPSHRSRVLSAREEVSRIKGIIATANAAASTGNASSLQGYLELYAEAQQKLSTAERRLREAEQTYDIICGAQTETDRSEAGSDEAPGASAPENPFEVR